MPGGITGKIENARISMRAFSFIKAVFLLLLNPPT
jgi:hypothetical protein